MVDARAIAREIPPLYLAAGAAALALGVLATPLRRLLFNVPVLLTIGGALLGRKEAKAETATPAKRPPAKRKPATRKPPAAKKAAAV